MGRIVEARRGREGLISDNHVSEISTLQSFVIVTVWVIKPRLCKQRCHEELPARLVCVLLAAREVVT